MGSAAADARHEATPGPRLEQRMPPAQSERISMADRGPRMSRRGGVAYFASPAQLVAACDEQLYRPSHP
jgi:hypothetical protein